MLTGFLRVWTQFMRGLPALETGQPYKIDKLSEGYRIAQDQTGARVEITVNPDLLITTVQITATNRTVTLHPQFSKTAEGYLATNLETLQTTPSGTLQTNMAVEYARVEGFQLPKTRRR